MRLLAIGPRLSGFFIIISTALAVFANLLDIGLTGSSKFVLGSIPAIFAVVGTVGNLRRDPQTAEKLFWPLAASLGAGASMFGVKQLLIDTGRLYQTTDSNLLRAYALSDFPLFIWTTLVGGMWLYSAAPLLSTGRLQSKWFATLESRPNTVRNILAAITGGAAVIRFWAAGRLGLWSDEGIVYIAARNILKTGLPYLETKLLYLRDLPHLYPVAVSLRILDDLELAIRLPSLIAGVLLVPLTYAVTEKLFGHKSVSLLAAAIVAVHPWMIEYSRFGRSYMLMLLLLYLAVYFFLTGLESRAARFGLAAAGFLAALTHQVGQIALLLGFVALLDKKWRAEPLKWWPFLGAAAGIVVYKVLFSYGYFFDQDTASSVSTTQAVAQRIPFALPRIDNLFVFMRIAPFFLLPTAIAASIRGRLLGFSDAGYRRYAAWFGIIVLALVFSKRLVTINRGILFFFPILAAGTALLVLFAVSLVRSRALRAAAASIIIVVIAGYGAYGLRQMNNRDYGTTINPNFAPFDGFTFAHDNKTTIEYVNKRYRPGDQIIVLGSPNFWVAYSKYRPNKRVWTGSSMTLNKKNVFVGTPETGDIGELDQSLRSKRTWVVTSFSTVWTPRIGHVAPHLVDYINAYSGQQVYVSKDVTAKVYLIDRRHESSKKSAAVKTTARSSLASPPQDKESRRQNYEEAIKMGALNSFPSVADVAGEIAFRLKTPKLETLGRPTGILASKNENKNERAVYVFYGDPVDGIHLRAVKYEPIDFRKIIDQDIADYKNGSYKGDSTPFAIKVNGADGWALEPGYNVMEGFKEERPGWIGWQDADGVLYTLTGTYGPNGTSTKELLEVAATMSE